MHFRNDPKCNCIFLWMSEHIYVKKIPILFSTFETEILNSKLKTDEYYF
jgi:hypothetical protein